MLWVLNQWGGQGKVLQFKLHLPTPILVLPFSLQPDINLAGRQINWSMQILPVTATSFHPPLYKTQHHNNLCVYAPRRRFPAHFGVCFAAPPGQSAAGAGLPHHPQREPVGRGDVPVRGWEQARRHLRQRRAQRHRWVLKTSPKPPQGSAQAAPARLQHLQQKGIVTVKADRTRFFLQKNQIFIAQFVFL